MKWKEIPQSDGFLLIALCNELGDELTLSQFGAGVYDFKIGGISLVHAPKKYEEYATSSGYHGKFVGPIAGRIEKGLIEVDGKTWHLPVNENGNCLHSASLCYAYKPFDCSPYEDEDSVGIRFQARFPASEGYLADVDSSILYRLSKKAHRLEILMEATPSIDAPINLTTHLYWNLGESSIYPMELTLREKEVGLYDEALLPKGFASPIPELDFSLGKEVGKDVASPSLLPVHGYDHAFLVEEGEKQAILKGSEFEMEVTTDAPGFQIYSGNFPLEHTLMLNGEEDHLGSAITFEPVSRMDLPFNAKAHKKTSRRIVYRFQRREKQS